MSTITPGFHDTAPEVPTSLFENQNGRNFWIGRISTLDIHESQKMYDAASVLRANVYASLGYIARERVDSLGRETDEDDARSIHFVAVERPLQGGPNSNGHANVIGTSRLIVKSSPENKLPIEEHYFPEVFTDCAAEVGSGEVSRFISVHNSNRVQHMVALALLRAMTHYSIDQKIKANYCMVEAPLLRLMGASGIPAEVLGGVKNVNEYGGELLPVKIEPLKIIENSSKKVGKTALRRFFLDGAQNLGEGFYTSSFLLRNQ